MYDYFSERGIKKEEWRVERRIISTLLFGFILFIAFSVIVFFEHMEEGMHFTTF